MYNQVTAHVTAPTNPAPVPVAISNIGSEKEANTVEAAETTEIRKQYERKSGGGADNKWKHCGYSEHGLGEEGGPRPRTGHLGFLFPSGPSSQKNLNECLILDSVVSWRAIYRAGAVLRGSVTGWSLAPLAAPLQMSSGVGVLERALPPRERDSGARFSDSSYTHMR